MNKQIKILFRLNVLSYLAIILIYFLVKNGNIYNLNNLVKFSIGSIPLILIVATSFVLASDANKNFNQVKNMAKLDWGIRLIAYIITLYEVNALSNDWHIWLVIILFLMNCAIEYKIKSKLNNCINIDSNGKIHVSYEEKCNLNNMAKSVNLAIFSWIIFVMICLNVSSLKNTSGAENVGMIPVIGSIIVTIWFTKTNHKNYMRFYLDKAYAKKIFIRDLVIAIVGYIICLILAFINLKNGINSYIVLIGILFAMPMMNSIRKMSLRLKDIRDSIGKEEYSRFIVRGENNKAQFKE